MLFTNINAISNNCCLLYESYKISIIRENCVGKMRAFFTVRAGGIYTNHCDKLCKGEWPHLQCSAVPEKLWWDTQTQYMIIPQTNISLYKESKLNSALTPALFAA